VVRPSNAELRGEVASLAVLITAGPRRGER
jgi:hypothetical protein